MCSCRRRRTLNRVPDFGGAPGGASGVSKRACASGVERLRGSRTRVGANLWPTLTLEVFVPPQQLVRHFGLMLNDANGHVATVSAGIRAFGTFAKCIAAFSGHEALLACLNNLVEQCEIFYARCTLEGSASSLYIPHFMSSIALALQVCPLRRRGRRYGQGISEYGLPGNRRDQRRHDRMPG